MKKIGVIGSGSVGQILADGFLALGHEVMRGSRDLAKLGEWRQKAGAHAHVGSFAETAKFGEIVVLAVKGSAAEAAVEQCGPGVLSGKIVIDPTNPIADAPPTHGVLAFFTGPNESLMERLQKKAPAARFVKAFSCVGGAHMVKPTFGGVKPTMFICGNDPAAKTEVVGLLDHLGWETADMGAIEAARAIEPLCMLWCIPGMLRNEWTHAFKLLKK
jgi:predicted dinucleotide-binding enzyme